MISPRWKKILRDLGTNRLRTTLVVLSIAVGVFAFGTVLGAQEMISSRLTAAYMATNPASAILSFGFDDAFLHSIQQMPEIAQAEGRKVMGARVQVGPDDWRDIRLIAVPDFKRVQVSTFESTGGAWPPPKRELLVEQSALPLIKAQVGQGLALKLPDGTERQMRVAGTVHDIQTSAAFSGNATAYVTLDTMEWLGQGRSYNQLNLVVAQQPLDKQHIIDVADLVKSRVEKLGQGTPGITIPDPGKHPADQSVQAVLLILTVLGFLSLGLSGFLIVNTISALLAQQVRQIGMMKAIGARNRQIGMLYFGMVLMFSLLALAIAVPLSAVGMWALTQYVATLVNFNPGQFALLPQMVALEAAVSLIVPVLAALVPILNGTRISVHRALNSYGVDSGWGRSLVDRLIEQVRGLSRPMLLSLRNTFRRKARLALTLITLTLAGAIFIAVFSVRDSLMVTLDDALRYWNYDVGVYFDRPYRVQQLEDEALRVPGVAAAESWDFRSARRLDANGNEGRAMTVIAPPADTQMLQPTVLQGRWLQPGDTDALVVNTDVLADQPDIRVGDTVVLKFGQRKSTWTVVGVVRGVLTGRIAYANYATFARETGGTPGRAFTLQVSTVQHDDATQAQASKALEDHFNRFSMNVASTQTTSSIRTVAVSQFNIIIGLLLALAGLLALVGGLGLAGTMSINILERTREIGVMRAVGASDGAVQRIVVVEGVLIGVLSWGLGAVLAVPISQLLATAIGQQLLRGAISYTFSITGVALWLVATVVIAAVASFVPAWNASRLSVRQVLAYE